MNKACQRVQTSPMNITDRMAWIEQHPLREFRPLPHGRLNKGELRPELDESIMKTHNKRA